MYVTDFLEAQWVFTNAYARPIASNDYTVARLDQR
jgi:hypothetical protein